jgi:hypothetical protein
MGQKLNPILVNEIRHRLELNESLKSIARHTKVQRNTVRSIRLNYELFGGPYAPNTVKLGRRRNLTLEQEDVCIASS